MRLRRLRLVLLAGTIAGTAWHCKTPGPAGSDSSVKGDDATTQETIQRYEAWRIQGLAAAKDCKAFKPEEGLFVTKRDASGNAVEGTLRVLSDNPGNDVWVVGDFNQWGAAKTEDDHLKPVAGTPYFEGKVRALKHGMQYRILLNGKQVLDPAALMYTPAPDFLNGVFWDFDRPGAYKMATKSVDLRKKPLVIAESEVLELARKWKFQGKEGPQKTGVTYRFVAESGLIQELKSAGYNAIEFLPFNTSMDGEHWHFRYQVYGLFAPDSRYGTPDEFAQMIDAFNKAGLAVIMDAVVGHYPFQGNGGQRELGPIGIHQWKKADGQALFGAVASPWGTNRYDYANPYVRRFLSDSIVTMLCRYGISGIRFDNLDGIRLYDGPGGGGPEFLKLLVQDVRDYRPEALLIAEMFFGYAPVLQRLDEDGFGIGFRTHSDFFDFLKDNMQKSTDGVDMARLRNAIRGPWEWKEAARVQYATNHDEAANRRDGATGSYLATLLNGGGWYYVEKKTMAFGSLALLSSAAYLDMPQMRLLQEGSFNDNSAVEWGLKAQDSQKQVYAYFAMLSSFVKDKEAWAFHNVDGDIENHIDTDDGRRIISLRRKDAASGKVYLAVINLGHVAQANYKVGIDGGNAWKVVVDGDRKEFGGTGELLKRLPGGSLVADGPGLHGKSKSVSIPYLAPYATVVLEGQ